ncbi:MAG: PIG-L family deacetylase [Armatimonadota bacterium]|nr:PIG-L family deacetylase [Armatimonadota bacterium]
MKALVVVAHPDDETIWTGGLMLRHPGWDWTVLSLCRSEDIDRAPRFYAATKALGAKGLMSNLDDSPVLSPLSPTLVEITSRIIKLSPVREYDYIITHGEYSRHERHEQVHKAVRDLVARGKLTGRLVFFAYSDDGRSHPPRPVPNADLTLQLSEQEFEMKRQIVERIYGFTGGSFEHAACGMLEAFRAYSRTNPMSELQMLEELRSERRESLAYSNNV